MANFAIGTKVRLYRKQQDPVGGDVARIPPKESVGNVVALAALMLNMALPRAA
jgi:hypothetical protein